jgi:hypothetical protein
MMGYSEMCHLNVNTPSTFDQFLFNLPVYAKWAVQTVEVIGDWGRWALASQHHLHGVSDGSFKNEFGTAAFIILSADDPEVCIRGRAVTPGNRDDQNAYRSELTGIYAMTIIQWALSEFFGIQNGSIEVACDGKSALEQAQWSEDFINTSYPHYDMILAIRSIRLLTQWTWSWRHVKGHQDATGTTLDYWAQLNVDMDTDAKRHWADTQSVVTPVQRIWGEPWSIWLGSKKITSKLSQILYEHCSSQPAHEYWRSKPRIGTYFDMIDWELIGGAMKQVPLNRQIWILKHVTGFCATGNNMLRRKVRTSAQCPRCVQDETPEHVWTCRGADTNAIWDKSLKNLKSWLLENSTHPEMAKAIIEYLDSWRNDTSPTTYISQAWMRSVFAGQSPLGWRNMLEGFLTVTWQTTQKTYFARLGSARSPKRWTIALIQKMWEVAWNMWEHRNGILHDKEQSIILQSLNDTIREEFRKGGQGLPKEARALFSQGCGVVLAKPVEVRQQWVARLQLARSRAASEQSLGQTFDKERQAMARWLKQKP